MIRLIRFDLSDSNFFSMKFFIFSSFLFYYNDKQLKAMILLLINSIAVNSRSAIFWFNYVGLLLERTFNMRKSEFNNELNIFFYYSLYLKKMLCLFFKLSEDKSIHLIAKDWINQEIARKIRTIWMSKIKKNCFFLADQFLL